MAGDCEWRIEQYGHDDEECDGYPIASLEPPSRPCQRQTRAPSGHCTTLPTPAFIARIIKHHAVGGDRIRPVGRLPPRTSRGDLAYSKP